MLRAATINKIQVPTPGTGFPSNPQQLTTELIKDVKSSRLFQSLTGSEI
jgi:hypothetical protein